MNLDAKWVPMKWPCGPLDLSRRSKVKGAGADLKDTLDAWAQPAALDVLKGSPVNCLVVDWADGAPEDSAQQQALKPIIEAGRKRGIAFVGKVAAGDKAAAVASAHAAGLSAVMLTEPAGNAAELPIILQSPRDKMPWDSATPIFSTTENEWPGLKLETMQGDTASAGPTGVPWVNSNAWFSLLAKVLAPEKTVWLDFDPPEPSNMAHPANFALAVADSQAYGSRWIISLDDNFRAALVKGNPQAASVWSKTGKTIAFFEEHREWGEFPPLGVLAVISDFRGENAFMSGETMNLLNRRGVQFQLMERSKAFTGPMAGFKAGLWLDKDGPTAEQTAKSLAFVRQGGLLIAPTYWGPAGVTPTPKDPGLDYQMYNVGQGQIAVPNQGFLDPYQVALDAHLLVSRRNDLVRIYNPATTAFHTGLDPVHKKRVVQILNYAPRAVNFCTLWVNTHAASARLWAPGAKDAVAISGAPGKPGTEFGLPAISVTCAMEVEV